MANEENREFDLRSIFEQQQEEYRLRQEEFRLRYEERKRKKLETRRMIESAAVKICETVEKAVADAPEPLNPEELIKLAAALNNAAAAMQAAEQYAEYTPYPSGGLAIGCAV